ncbi:hypothetical protein BH11ACT2_BH11ACT2_19540 [soil metagenome]
MRVIAPAFIALASALVASAAIVAPVAPAAPAAAASGTVATAAALVNAVGSSGTSTLSADVSDPVLTLGVTGVVVLDLHGNNVTVQRVQLQGGSTLTITNTGSTRGTFTADASSLSGSSAIRTTGAVLVVSGSVDLVAIAGPGGAGIGGDQGSGAGAVKTRDSSTVFAQGKLSAAAIGAGKDGTGAGSLDIGNLSQVTVKADSSAATAIGDSGSIGVLTIGSGARLTIPATTTVFVQEPTGSGASFSNEGTIVVNGTLTGAGNATSNSGTIAGPGTISLTNVIGGAYTITFDASPGTIAGAATVQLYADSFAAAAMALPSATRSGYTFVGWQLGGLPLSSATSLSAMLAGLATPGSATPQSATATATWKLRSSVSLTVTPSSIAYGGDASFGAVVPGATDGSVEFFAGAVSLGSVPIDGGSAQLVEPWPLDAGSYAITAKYTDDGSAGVSSPKLLTVSKAATTVLIDVAASATVGQRVLVTASVVPPAAAGTIAFSIGGTPQATSTIVDGQATFFTPATLAVASYQITAQYSGSVNFSSTTAARSFAVTAAQLAPNTNTGSSENSGSTKDGSDGKDGKDGSDPPSVMGTNTAIWLSASSVKYGATASVSAHIAAGAGGTVTFSDGARPLGSAPVVAGYAELALPRTLTPGAHGITAVYSGDATHGGSASSATWLTVTRLATTVKVRAKPFARHSRPRVVVTIANGAKGPVAIYVGPKKVKTVTVTKATTTITLAKRYTKAITLRVVYRGSTVFATAKSPAVRVATK